MLKNIFKVKFDTKTNQICKIQWRCLFYLFLANVNNLNMKNSILMFVFCVFDRKYTFFWKFVPKIKIVEG